MAALVVTNSIAQAVQCGHQKSNRLSWLQFQYTNFLKKMIYFILEINMENQPNIGDQNTQPVGQNPVAQPTVMDKPKTNLASMLATGLVCSLVFGFGGYILGKQSSKPVETTNQYQTQPTSVPTTSPTSSSTMPNQPSEPVWQSYTNSGALYEVQYPIGWRVVPYNIGEGYGPKETGEDVLWAINFYEKKDYTLDKVAAEFGKQFSDRKQTKEDVMLNNIPAVKFTTTTASIPDWYLVNIVVERGTSYIVMSNGAITNENLQKMRGVVPGTTFDRFYKSFHFVN